MRPRSFIASVTKIVPDGTYAVKLLLSHPDASVLNGLTSLNLAMLSTKSIAAGTLAKTPVGTGPYQFVELGAEQLVHGQGQPGLVGRQGDASAGRDQDDSERAVDRVGAAGGDASRSA